MCVYVGWPGVRGMIRLGFRISVCRYRPIPTVVGAKLTINGTHNKKYPSE